MFCIEQIEQLLFPLVRVQTCDCFGFHCDIHAPLIFLVDDLCVSKSMTNNCSFCWLICNHNGILSMSCHEAFGCYLGVATKSMKTCSSLCFVCTHDGDDKSLSLLVWFTIIVDAEEAKAQGRSQGKSSRQEPAGLQAGLSRLLGRAPPDAVSLQAGPPPDAAGLQAGLGWPAGRIPPFCT